jgi:hypothetical protein
MPLPVPRSRVSDDARRHGFHAGLFLEHGEGLTALGRIELGAENLIFELNAVQIGLEALVLLAYIQQHEVIFEEIDAAATAAFEQSRQWRYRGDGPHADQADFLVALDLVGQQHQLDENRRHRLLRTLFHVFIRRLIQLFTQQRCGAVARIP